MERKRIIRLHIIFWVLTLFTIGLESIPSFGKTPVNTILIDNLIYAVSFISLFYLYYFFISKKHLGKRKMVFLIIFGLLFTLIYTIPVTGIFIYILHYEVYELKGKEFLFEYRTYYFMFLEINFMFAVSGSLLKTALLWYDNVIKQKELEKQSILNELALLRSQINPQFLFNTLAGIKSLIETQPEKAIRSIENLSEIMSYMLYETTAEKVLLDDEIDNINVYLNLQEIRYTPGFIKFNVTGKTSGIKVPPLIFMPFMENTFKHGNDFSVKLCIVINLDVTGNNLSFEVMNCIKENTDINQSDNGLYLTSIKRYLDLQFGDNKYTLETKNENNKYLAKLAIKL